MYRPAVNDVADEAVVFDLIRDIQAGHLATSVDGELASTLLPFVLDEAERRLHGHVARANPHWRSIDGANAMVIFAGADAYVSPSWYETKRETGKVVPTWNYTVVHVYGRVRVHDDMGWLRPHVAALTDQNERVSDAPWAVTDAPTAYIDKNLRAIVGIEIEIERLEGKRKLSQNRSEADVAGVVEGLARGTHRDRAVADDMRALT
jgi:transcriptional regulator